MALLVWIVLALVALVVVVAFLQRFYQKTTRDTALLRTGAGGQVVAFDGGFFALPMLHRVDEINMRAHRILVSRNGEHGLLTRDRLRADATLELRLRVGANAQAVATAAQTWGARALRSEELGHLLEGRFVDVIQGSAARRSLEGLHEERTTFVAEIRDALAPELLASGLQLESVALVHLDQTSLAGLSADNAFNAEGMRRLSEVVAVNRKLRAEIEAGAEVAVAQTQLEARRRRLELDRSQREAEEDARLGIESARTRVDTDIARTREESQRDLESARISRERDIEREELDRQHALEQARLANKLVLELQRVSHAIELTRQQQLEAQAAVEGEQARARLMLQQEQSLTEREEAVARRQHQVAIANAAREAEADALKVQAEANRVIAKARSEADAVRARADADHVQALAHVEAERARIAADNTQSTELMRLRLELARIAAVPELAEKLAKPLEKIESFRVHHISGLGNGAGAGSLGAPVEALYDMALNLPVLRKLGETLGADLDMTMPQLARAESDHMRAQSDHARAALEAEKLRSNKNSPSSPQPGASS